MVELGNTVQCSADSRQLTLSRLEAISAFYILKVRSLMNEQLVEGNWYESDFTELL